MAKHTNDATTQRVNLNIRARMVRRDVSTEQIAEAIDVVRESAYRKLRGETPWMLGELTTVADLLGYDDVADLFAPDED